MIDIDKDKFFICIYIFLLLVQVSYMGIYKTQYIYIYIIQSKSKEKRVNRCRLIVTTFCFFNFISMDRKIFTQDEMLLKLYIYIYIHTHIYTHRDTTFETPQNLKIQKTSQLDLSACMVATLWSGEGGKFKGGGGEGGRVSTNWGWATTTAVDEELDWAWPN